MQQSHEVKIRTSKTAFIADIKGIKDADGTIVGQNGMRWIVGQ